MNSIHMNSKLGTAVRARSIVSKLQIIRIRSEFVVDIIKGLFCTHFLTQRAPRSAIVVAVRNQEYAPNFAHRCMQSPRRLPKILNPLREWCKSESKSARWQGTLVKNIRYFFGTTARDQQQQRNNKAAHFRARAI
jgi:hypothetical protein